jgi:hypothetical protein
VAQLASKSKGWTDSEFEQLDLGDARLNRRARTLMETTAGAPTASAPKACNGWVETMAAYRFFDNDGVDWRAILEARGLGPLSYEAQRGMYVHPTYAVSTAREPLGILDVWMWARELRDTNGKRGGPKESLRWIEGYERLAELAPRLPATRLVYVADREVDMLPLMARAQQLDCPVDWLVRAAHNRCLPNSDKLWPHAMEDYEPGFIHIDIKYLPQMPDETARRYLFVAIDRATRWGLHAYLQRHERHEQR